MRINRYIARSGITSRRKAEDLIKSGRITVNGKIVTDLATEISESDKVAIEGTEIQVKENKYYLFNKPTRYTTTHSDPYAMHTIFELLPPDSSLFAVGRLDRDTTGLILVTNDGSFAQNIIHPTQKIEKEYLVRTLNKITDDQLEELLKGVELEDGVAVAKKVERISEKEIMLVIEMGRKRVVRRMIEFFGNKVISLKRTRIGEITLDVPVGGYRKLSAEEIKKYA